MTRIVPVARVCFSVSLFLVSCNSIKPDYEKYIYNNNVFSAGFSS